MRNIYNQEIVTNVINKNVPPVFQAQATVYNPASLNVKHVIQKIYVHLVRMGNNYLMAPVKIV